jgi:hypothetical protein
VQVLSEEIPPTRLVCNIYIDVRSSVVYCCEGMLNLISIQPQVSEQYAILRVHTFLTALGMSAYASFYAFLH